MESEIDKYCKMIDNVFNGFALPISIPKRQGYDCERLLEKVIERQRDKLIVNVNTSKLLEKFELITPEMFLKAYFNGFKDACKDIECVAAYLCQTDVDDIEYGVLYDFIEILPEIVIDSVDDIDGVIVIIDEYYQLKSRMPNYDYLYYLFKNNLLQNHDNVCYIFIGSLHSNKRVFKAEYRYFENGDVLAIKVKRDFKFLKTLELRYDLLLDLDIYKIPISLKILDASKKMDVNGLDELSVDVAIDDKSIEIIIKSHMNYLTVLCENKEYVQYGEYQLDFK